MGEREHRIIFNFDTRMIKVVRLTPRLLHIMTTQGEISRYSPNKKQVGIQTRYGRFGVQKNFLAVPGIDPHSFDFPGINLVTIPNEILQLSATS